MSTLSQSPVVSPLGYASGVRSVFALEMKQRLRTRSWYVLLTVWFFVIGLVAMLTALNAGSQQGQRGPVLFELMVGFVLFFGLLLAPALSANGVNGDRAAGTLAILQVTLLRPGQILAGKWLAAWVASLGFLVASVPFLLWALVLGGVRPLSALVAVVMLAVELGIVCAVGVGVSALAARPLFSIVVTYMLVALLGLGTLIAFGLSTTLTEGTVRASPVQYSQSVPFDPENYECVGEVQDMPALRTERVAWILAANPFVLVADAMPAQSGKPGVESGVMESISILVREAQAGPESGMPCVNGEKKPGVTAGSLAVTPIWPLGLGIQLAVAALLLFLGRRRLVTPVRNLSAGTRIA
ncbi:ABC transporter permease [Arthrobacter sp. zg-Y750]|uniref:ABC transporter permease n=1 Tax=Arthrobacter sp. zg-Y750 TaxID=2894189 RepID=UPI001E4134FA|nr:ABC transporter permease subunit [Arthrobacter sp. zg-Y750]MCC9177273.1 ABC transporter permease [Arthrobacter sp. zg-Y750]